jgi:hypothetical protein
MMQDDKLFLQDKHLRLTLQIEKNKSEILDIDVIDEPLVELGRVVGPFIMSVAFGGRLVWAITMQDPFIHRGMPRRGEHEHHYESKGSATVVVRVPIPRDSMPADFRVGFYRASEPLPESVRELEKLLCSPKICVFEHLSTVGLSTLQKHPDWGKILEQAGIKPCGSKK